ncbi:MAG: PP2C family protein-serine/threonine phosphatase, partial [Planctomycetia bacterium]
AAKYIPLEEAGGDFYAVNTVGEKIHGYFLGDISGHDISTSYLTAALNALLRQNCTALNSPMEAMQIINNVLYGIFEGEGRFLAASYLAINRANNTASFINMGNPPMLAIAPDKPPRIVFSRGMPLGIFEKTTFQVFRFPVNPGERFYLLTDGLLEMGDSVWTTSTDRLLEIADEMKDSPLGESVEQLCRTLVPDFDNIYDDIACLATEV